MIALGKPCLLSNEFCNKMSRIDRTKLMKLLLTVTFILMSLLFDQFIFCAEIINNLRPPQKNGHFRISFSKNQKI